MRPTIGITCDYDWDAARTQIYSGYYEAVFRSGGLPFLLPCLESDCAQEMIARLDGLLLTGGQDMDSYLFDEEPSPQAGAMNPYRDGLEIALCRGALERGVPVLGICKGIQVMNVMMGGDIYQDIHTQIDTARLVNHDQRGPKWYGIHKVSLAEGSKLRGIFGRESLRVNSFHHQAVRRLGTTLKAAAHTRDGIIEAIESEAHPFYLGVQWHPERMLEKSEDMLRLFGAFVDAARP